MAVRVGDGVPVEPQVTGDGDAAMAGFATFTTDLEGRLAAWGLTAGELFGHAAGQVLGQHVRRAAAQRAPRCRAGCARGGRGGRARTALSAVTCADGSATDVALRWEPSAGPPGMALVLARRAAPRSHDLLTDAATRIGSTLDLAHTAGEAVGLAVPGFADAAGIYLPERLMTAGEFAWQAGDRPVAMRRLAANIASLSRRAREEMFRSRSSAGWTRWPPTCRAPRSPPAYTRSWTRRKANASSPGPGTCRR